MNTQSNRVQPESAHSSVLARSAVFVYGVAAYALFLAVFLYAIGFIGNFGVPKSLDSPGDGPWETGLFTDLALLAAFALQHSIMARPAFKRLLTRIIPVSAERSTYVLASSIALAVLFWKWQPLGGMVWNVEAPLGRVALYAGYAFGWGLVLFSTFVINHFDLFGLRQIWRHVQGQPQARVQFAVPFLYRIVRHPLYVGWLFAFWCTPTMTATHLLFAVMTTAYILIAIRFEEADLVNEHPQYAAYRKQVPMLVPRLTREVTLRDQKPARDSVRVATLMIAAFLAVTAAASAQVGPIIVPPIPDNLVIPAGNAVYMKTSAAGTQNYVCLPGANGPAWTFQGPQATVFLIFPWFGGEVRQQIMTHFLSANPDEAGRGRPTWHHSGDSSTVWGKGTAESLDPAFVKPNSIPWLRVEIAGKLAGPMGGTALTQTTYIHRLNTSGGIKPTTGCDESAYGKIAFVPYTTDYYFYRRAN
jgi:methanethiol S-methyltransferase